MPNKDKYDIQSDYLNSPFQNLNALVRETVEKLQPHADRFEAIAVRGVSGLLVGPMVASLLDKPWCIVRKPGEGTHSDHKTVEGWQNFGTYIIIDDLVATGGTLLTIQKTLRAYAEHNDHRWEKVPECIGYYLYTYDEIIWRGDGKNYAHQDKYFLFSEIPARTVEERISDFLATKGTMAPAVPEQISAAVATGPNCAPLTFRSSYPR